MRRFVLGLALLLAACRNPDDQLSPDETTAAIALQVRADSLLERVAHLEPREGFLTMGDASAPFTAYFEDGRLVLVEEHLDQGAYGQAHNLYVYDGDSLGTFRGTRRIERDGRVDSMEVALIRAEGKVLTGKRINGRKATMDAAEVQGAKHRADVLRHAALAPDTTAVP